MKLEVIKIMLFDVVFRSCLTVTKLRLFFHWRKPDAKTLLVAFCQFVASCGGFGMRIALKITCLLLKCQFLPIFVAKVFLPFFCFFHSQWKKYEKPHWKCIPFGNFTVYLWRFLKTFWTNSRRQIIERRLIHFIVLSN